MIYYKAIQVALKAHEHQFRKIDHVPYVAHPLEVGILLSKYGLSDETVVAGILHDTVEDTSLTLDDIRKQFGDTVAEYVDYCSETDKCDTWENRKIAYLERMENAPLEVLYIICADKLTNVDSFSKNLKEHGPAMWSRFNAGYESQKWYLSEALKRLERIKPHPLYDLLEAKIHALFDESTL